MKTAIVSACCLLTVILVGTGSGSLTRIRAKTLTNETRSGSRSPLQDRLVTGRRLLAAGQYKDGAKWFDELATTALKSANYGVSARAAANLGACEFALHRYQPALQAFLRARLLAETAGDTSATALIDASIASLYAEMGNLDAAIRWTHTSIAGVAGTDRIELPKLWIQLGVLQAKRGDMTQALGSFRQGIAGADAADNWDLYALGWNRLGEAYLLAGDLESAEMPLLEAYRIRKLRHLALDTSYRSLGRLRLGQGRIDEASHLLDRAVELVAHTRSLAPSWDVYHSRGMVRLAQNQLEDALSDFRIAIRLARIWRWSTPANDTVRIGTESMLDELYSSFIDAGSRLYARTHDPRLIRETFEVADENRAASLRASLAENQAPVDLPPAYWEILKQLQTAEVEGLHRGPRRVSESVEDLRAELTRIVATANPTAEPYLRNLLQRARSAMPADSVMFSFQLGTLASWVWAVDGNDLELLRLPPRGQLELQIARATRAIREDLPEADTVSADLYRTLFGAIPKRLTDKSRWYLALDKALIELPIAALVESNSGRATYVAERHTLEIIPGVAFWLDAAERQTPHHRDVRFVGIGDPVYNTADPRYVQPRRSPLSAPITPFQLVAASRGLTTNLPLLPRLVASAAELTACANAWGDQNILLEGTRAVRSNVIAAIAQHPAVLHFATHFLPSAASPSYSLITLSVGARGEAELLTPMEIAHWRTDAELVVLSGCHSAAGAVLPGTGLLGLTRAWLAAGAANVVSSRWATPDESGDLFAALYRNFRHHRSDGPARALAMAQREMIDSTGWRARPRYWGAYFVVGND